MRGKEAERTDGRQKRSSRSSNLDMMTLGVDVRIRRGAKLFTSKTLIYTVFQGRRPRFSPQY